MSILKNNNKDINNRIAVMMVELQDIYKNKSSDEYKMCGDITKASEYTSIERMLANLSTLKGYPMREGKDLSNLFNVLHRPIFKRMVQSYLTEQSERNITFTAVFTVGYRCLIGELARIYASTEATDKGIEYHPDKISKKSSLNRFIPAFTDDLETKIDQYIQRYGSSNIHQESVSGIVHGIFALGGGLAAFIKKHNLIEWGGWFSGIFASIFGTMTELNPISLINHILAASYDKKVAEYDNAVAMYEATKEAYDEYLKIPAAQRDKKVESKYMKNINKYNIRVGNLLARINHYDQRAAEEAKDLTKETTKDDGNNKKTSSKPKDSTNSNDDLDF